MDRVVAADTEAVTVSRDDPYAQLRSGSFQPGSDRGRPAVDRMHPIGVHVIWKPAAAADTRYNHDVLPGYSQRRHYLLDLGKDRIVAATRAPAYFLVGSEILRGEDRLDCCLITHTLQIYWLFGELQPQEIASGVGMILAMDN